MFRISLSLLFFFLFFLHPFFSLFIEFNRKGSILIEEVIFNQIKIDIYADLHWHEDLLSEILRGKLLDDKIIQLFKFKILNIEGYELA